MRHKRLKLCALLLLGLGLTGLKAQEGINATGGNATGSGGSASYSVGQVVYTTNTGANGTVAQGVQQPFEISVVVGIHETGINLSISAYPNPTKENLILLVSNTGQSNYDLTHFSYRLCDIQGKVLQNVKITDEQTNIVMHNLAPAVYFVNVLDGNKKVKTFKIIKN